MQATSVIIDGPQLTEPGVMLPTLEVFQVFDGRRTCDVCGTAVVAVMRATWPGDHEALYCGFHGRKHGYSPETHPSFLTEENKLQGSAN